MSDLAGPRIRGITIPLPPGERIRWEGSPRRRSLALHTFHLRKVAVYFALLVGWRAALSFGEPAPLDFFLSGALPLLGLGLVAAGLSAGLAYLAEQTSVYAITDRRIVMKIGVVLSSTINIPLRQVDSASLRRYGDGSGDLAIRLTGPDRLAYLLLWPHARAWHLRRPEPTLRSLDRPAEAAAVLRDVLQAALGPRPAPRPTISDGGLTLATSAPIRPHIDTPASVA